MAIIDDLEILDGVFLDDRFWLRGISGHAMNEYYTAEGLRAFARLVQIGEPLTLVIDQDRKILVPVEKNEQLKKELNIIADQLEN